MKIFKYYNLFLLVFFLTPIFIPALIAQDFTFYSTADMRIYAGSGIYDTSSYFRGVCEAIADLGSGDFMIINGDLDPPEGVSWTIEQYLGSDYVWYPVTGNHEAETPEDMVWMRNINSGGNSLPNVVNIGPPGCVETTFSFDYNNCHFIILNQYFDGTSDVGTNGDVVDALYNWLVQDLAQTEKELIFVIGHEPAYPQPDEFNGRERHMDDSLNQHPTNRDRFWQLLSSSGVYAYFCGHTHNYSSYYRDGVWQIDAGHARGIGDTGAPSTFIRVNISGNDVSMTVYRDIHDGIYDYDDITEDIALAVEMSSLTAGMDGSLPYLSWTTQSETNNIGWYIYREESDLFLSSLQLNNELIPGAGTTSQPTNYLYYDPAETFIGQTYWYWIESLANDGQTGLFGPVSLIIGDDQPYEDPPLVPVEYGLLQNSPNPFNPETMIYYRLEVEDDVMVEIYNVKGERVRIFTEGAMLPGLHNLSWNGDAMDGNPVDSGIYFCYLRVRDYTNSMKMLLLK